MPDHPVLAQDKASEWLGITVHTAERGHALISMDVREEMLNGFGIAHGGMVFALGDSCFALACNDPAGDGSTVTVAQGVDINFMRSPRLGETLTAEGREIATTGRSGLYDITITDSSGALVAQFRGRSRTVPNRQKA